MSGQTRHPPTGPPPSTPLIQSGQEFIAELMMFLLLLSYFPTEIWLITQMPES